MGERATILLSEDSLSYSSFDVHGRSMIMTIPTGACQNTSVTVNFGNFREAVR
jgi:hypothetical protein